MKEVIKMLLRLLGVLAIVAIQEISNELVLRIRRRLEKDDQDEEYPLN